jgi:PAS domain S-box-containing protein
MSQPIELILVRHLAGSLAIPLFLVDPDGTMVFYNEAAERILGRRYDEAGEMSFDEWTTIFAVRDDAGKPLDINQLPLVRALRARRPAHHRFAITGLDGTRRDLEVSAFPLEAEGQRMLGAVALFWESEPDGS